ncbi:glycosyltransferase family 4 protein [Candidatus Kuenenbacteria bacterium]|nr:glycosyltransferase family 4 protein [Candidatus Kuenenbacteria bacterium]
MKKILLVTIDFWPKIGGVANYYFNLCRHLEKDRIVVLTQRNGEQILPPAQSFKIYRKNLVAGRGIWPRWLPMLWQIWQVVRKEKVELIWVGEVLPSGTAIYFLSKFLKLPYIVSCHGNDILQAEKFRRKKKLAEKILRGAKWVTVNSQYTGELVKSLGVSRDKIKVVHPGVTSINQEQSAFQSGGQAGGRKSKKILLSIGRLVERKGFDKVIEALPKVWQKLPDLVYALIGSGEDEKRIKNLIDKGNQDKIIFINKKISDEEKWAWLEQCAAFIMVPRADGDDTEGFGIVYLEANSFGKPVIAANVGGVPDAVEDGVSGLLVNPENEDEIAGAIIKLFCDDNLREKLGRQGKARAEEKFNWPKIAEDFKELLK